MNSSKIFLLFLLLFGTVVYSNAQRNDFARGAASKDDLRRAIEEVNQEQIEAFKRGDLLSVARFYADDATIYFPHYPSKQGRKIQGREAIDKRTR